MGVPARLRGRARERRIPQLEHELAVADERISRIHAAETVEELRRATTLPRRPRRFPHAAIPAAAGAVVVAAAIAISLAVGHSPSRTPSRPGPVPSPSQAAADDPQGTGTFWIENRNGVSITFPPGWRGVGQDERGLTYAVGRDVCRGIRSSLQITPETMDLPYPPPTTHG